MEVKQVIVVRRNYPDGKGGMFKPRLGKLAAQVAHASMKVFFDRKITFGGPLQSVGIETPGGPGGVGAHGQEPTTHFTDLPPCYLFVPLDETMARWVNGLFKKIVLMVDGEADLLRCYEEAKARGLPVALVTDMGATEFHGVPTNTAVAIGPAVGTDIDPITGPGGLVRTTLA